MSIQQWHIDKCEDSVYPVKTPAGNWMRTVDVIAALAAKEREIEDWRGWQKKLMEILGMNGTESWSDLCAVRGLIAENERLKAQVAAARATIAALQWTPITPDNFPKVGDEAYSGNDGDFLYVHSCDLGTAQEWTNEGWTHFRPISPPAQDSAA